MGNGLEVESHQVRTLPPLVLDPAFRPPAAFDLDLRRERFDTPPLFVRGEVTTLENPAFDPERVEEGVWAPLTAAKKTAFGVYLLEPYDPDKTPVLFVPGMNSSPRELAPLIAALDRTRYQPWVAYFPSGGRLYIIAHLLRDVMSELVDRLHPKRVAVVAHSMGGLVARSMLLQSSSFSAVVAPLVTISTPYEGIPLAAQGLRYAPEIVPAWIDLASGSEFLELLRRPLPAGLPFYLFFGTGERSAKVPEAKDEDNDGVVLISSELADYAQAQALHAYGFNAGHAGILSNPEMQERLRSVLELAR